LATNANPLVDAADIGEEGLVNAFDRIGRKLLSNCAETF
jgi:hypothetical protein